MCWAEQGSCSSCRIVWRLLLCLAGSFLKAQCLPEQQALLGKGAAGSGHLLMMLCLYPPAQQDVSTKSDENQGLKSKT